jgi:hypothetical protein
MQASTSNSFSRAFPWILFWVHGISQLMMWVDEGYYDFRWMSDGWNWVIYFVYTTVVVLTAAGFYKLFFSKQNGHPLKTGISIIVGFVFVVLLLLVIWMLR